MENRPIHTDLAMESAPPHTPMAGVKTDTQHFPHVTRTRIEVTTREAAQALGRPRGIYVTFFIPDLSASSLEDYQTTTSLLTKELLSLLPQGNTPLLIVGLGNPNVASDSFGTRTAQRILPFTPRGYQGACILTPGIKEKTGMESADVVWAVAQKTQVRGILVLDSLLARNRDSLLNCIQLSNTGIVPGSGVSAHKKAINQETMGVPVISVGIPTMIRWEAEGLPPLYVSPQNVDDGVTSASLLMSDSIQRLFYP